MPNMHSTDPRMDLCIITGLSSLASSSIENSKLKLSGRWVSSCKQPVYPVISKKFTAELCECKSSETV